MDRTATLLQVFQSKLRGWLPAISRATHGIAEILPTKNGEFEVVVRGTSRAGEPWEHRKLFDRSTCFGSTYTGSPAAWQVDKRPCDHARLLIEEVLRNRGVL